MTNRQNDFSTYPKKFRFDYLCDSLQLTIDYTILRVFSIHINMLNLSPSYKCFKNWLSSNYNGFQTAL